MANFDVRGLIFDMDGVLVDSEPCHLQAYQELFARFGLPYTADDNREFLGRKDITILEILNKRHQLGSTPEALVAEKEAILARLLADATARPGVTKLLNQARSLGIPAAVASSATLPTIELIVDTLDIRTFFKSLTSGDEVAHGKPAPDVFLLAAERLQVEPRHCLVIEDTYNGILAAKAAGMRCIAIPCDTTRHQDHSIADRVMQTMEDVDLLKLQELLPAWDLVNRAATPPPPNCR